MDDYQVFKKEALNLIESELSKRKKRNTSYSLRAFARDLDVSAATLSRILKGADISPATYMKILEKLDIKKITKGYIQSLFSKCIGEKGEFEEREYKYWSKIGPPISLSAEDFSKISRLKCISLYCYLFYNKKVDFKEIEEALHISPEVAKAELDSLIEVGLIEVGLIEVDDSLSISAPQAIHLVVEDSIQTLNVKFNIEVFNELINYLHEETDENEPGFCQSTVFAINNRSLPEAKEFIRNVNLEFQRRFCVQPSDVEESENYSVAVMSAAMKILTESNNTTPI